MPTAELEPRTTSRPRPRLHRPGGDAALVRRVRAGDEQAFAAIFERHHAPLLSYCRHMLGDHDEAEDALQQAFIRAYKALRGGPPPRELRPWLYAVARNCCLSAIAARRPTTPLEERTPSLAGLSEQVREREDLRELVTDIGRLPEDQRSALLLSELGDLSHSAIAMIVGCPINKVKALVYQARSTLLAERDARDASCPEIREQLAVARGGELRRGPLRRHLNMCTGCRDFQHAIAAQRRSLAAVLPVAPSAVLAARVLGHGALLHAASTAGLGSAGSSAGGVATVGGTAGGVTATASTGAGATTAVATGTTAAASAVGGGASTGALVGGGVLAKVAVGGAVAALATVGAVTIPRHSADAARRTPTTRSHRAGSARAALSANALAQVGGTMPHVAPSAYGAPQTGADGLVVGAAGLAQAGGLGTLASPLPTNALSATTALEAIAPANSTQAGSTVAGTNDPSGDSPSGVSPSSGRPHHPGSAAQRARLRRLRHRQQLLARHRLLAQRRRAQRALRKQRRALKQRQARERREAREQLHAKRTATAPAPAVATPPTPVKPARKRTPRATPVTTPAPSGENDTTAPAPVTTTPAPAPTSTTTGTTTTGKSTTGTTVTSTSTTGTTTARTNTTELTTDEGDDDNNATAQPSRSSKSHRSGHAQRLEEETDNAPS